MTAVGDSLSVLVYVNNLFNETPLLSLDRERDKEKLARALEKVQVRVQLLLACRPPLMPGASRRT